MCLYFFASVCLQMFSMQFDGMSSERSKSQNTMTETKTKLDDSLKMFVETSEMLSVDIVHWRQSATICKHYILNANE